MATPEREPISYQSGAGGKFRKYPLKKAQTTPYDRPTTALRRNPSWVSKMIVDPASKLVTATAHRFFSSVRNRILPPPANQESSDRFQETVLPNPVRDQGQLVNDSGKQGISEGQALHTKDSGKKITDSTGLSELELMFKQKTFTRSEINRLTALLHSRTVESSNGYREKNTEFHSQETASALRGRDNFASFLHERRDERPLDNHMAEHRHHGRASTAVGSSKVLEEDVPSPTELAKAYMDNRSSKVSPSVSGLHSQAMREDTSALCDSPFAPGSSVISLVQKPSIQGRVLENGFATPRSKGRSAIYSMARTPYSRVHPTASNKGNRSIYNGSCGPSASSTGFARELVARSVSKDLALKRRSSVLDDDIGSVGPIRKLRQKTNLSTPNNTGSSIGRTSYFSHGNGIIPNGALHPSSSSKTSQGNEDNESMPGTSHTPVPSQSKETARKILQQLQKLTPKEKQLEGKIGDLSENLPTKLTPNMLHGQALRSLENIDSSKVFQGVGYSLKHTQKDPLPDACETSSQKEDKVEENGPKSFNASHGSLVPVGTGNGTVLSKDSVPGFSISDPVKKKTVTQPSPKKCGFQMSAHEDFLDLDDEIHTSEADASTKITKSKNLLERPVVVKKVVPVTEDKPTPISEFKEPTGSSKFGKPTDLGTSDVTNVVEKSSGFMFSAEPAASSVSPPVFSVSQSTFAKNAPDKEPNVPPVSSSGAKIDDNVSSFTFSSSPFVGGSVCLNSGPPVETNQENTNSFQTNVSSTTEAVPKPADSDNGTINMEKPEDTLERPESLPSLPKSTSSLFTYGSNPTFSNPSNGSLNSTTASLFSSPAPIIPPTNSENQTLSNPFTAIPFSTKISSNASSEATPSTSVTATSSSVLAPAFKFESTSTSTIPTPSLTTTPDFKESSFVAPSTYSTVLTTSSAATDVKTSIEKQALPSNPFSAMSSPLAGTGSSVFGFNAGSTSSSAASQGSIFGAQSMPVFGSSATPSTMGTSGSTPFAPSSTSSSPAFGNTTSNSFAFGSNGTSSSSLFSSSTSSNSPFGLSTTFKDSGATPSSTVFSFGAQSSQSPVFGSPTSSSAFSFSSAPQSQPMFGNTVVPAFGSGGNNGMAEDSMAEDLAGPASTPSVPVCGQPLVSNPSPNPFMFGSTPATSSSGVVPFQFGGQPFGGQQSQPGQQNANPFQSPGSGLNLGVGGDGSFSLGSGGGDDKSTRRIVRVKHRNRGKR